MRISYSRILDLKSCIFKTKFIRWNQTMTKINVINILEEREKMMNLWPSVVRDLTNVHRQTNMPDLIQYITKILEYNVPNGKKSRGLSVVFTYKMLANPEQVTEENVQMARILGWVVELVEAFLLIEDDMMDQSKVRRGQPCWYLNVGSTAISDGLLLKEYAFQFLKIHFKEHPCYPEIIELLREIGLLTTIGQFMDLQTSYNESKNKRLDKFTMERYNLIVKYKTAYYTFVLPVALAMYFAEIKNSKLHQEMHQVLLEIGQMFQIQDDFLDCFGDPKITGKEGTDIQEGKCTWLAVVALQRATPTQRRIMEECYGVNDIEKAAQVKQLYHDLELQSIFSQYEEETYCRIKSHIDHSMRDSIQDLLMTTLENTYKRIK